MELQGTCWAGWVAYCKQVVGKMESKSNKRDVLLCIRVRYFKVREKPGAREAYRTYRSLQR